MTEVVRRAVAVYKFVEDETAAGKRLQVVDDDRVKEMHWCSRQWGSGGVHLAGAPPTCPGTSLLRPIVHFVSYAAEHHQRCLGRSIFFLASA